MVLSGLAAGTDSPLTIFAPKTYEGGASFLTLMLARIPLDGKITTASS